VKRTSRNKIIEHLEKQGIETRPFFYPLHTMPPYKHNLKFPVAEELSARGLNLPSGLRISENQVERVIESLREVLNT
jgi:perosamine synthetase